jgi:hypothetical protein
MQLLFTFPCRNEVACRPHPNPQRGPRATILFVPGATPTGEDVKHEIIDIILLLPQLPAATNNATSSDVAVDPGPLSDASMLARPSIAATHR